ncbi:Autophagy-related protein [Pseudocercospora fuligena]|uniref:Autophagy-related protein 13 n=1 Tax=Pseudocercospora fuligena TaxID=685502 RepID=A0A8H6RHP6_9PEZI|nr:Autophagy-related protein [Pseudocercospora fuligena]
MHQHPRPSPRSASAASNPSTNPERTNNSRDRPPQRTRSSVDLASYTEKTAADNTSDSTRAEGPSGSLDRETTKLNQIIQHFHSKAALTICSSRANLPQVVNKHKEIKQNRWFNVVLDDTDVLVDDLQPWRRTDLSEKRPPPLVIEVYVETSHLTQSQTLIIVDEFGKRWDVADALGSSADSSPRTNRNGGRLCEVVLERWTVELGDLANHASSELNDALPNVYKKGVVLFRSLYSFARLLPAWKFHRTLTRQPGNHQALRLRFRIKQGHDLSYGQQDSLYSPLCRAEHDSDATVERYRIPPLLCRSGPLSVSVEYRTNCEFNVADSEALLSSRFLGLDEGIPTMPAGRSLPGARSEQSRVQHSSLAVGATEQRARVGAYGSLGTFHASGKRASPVTELKQRVMDDDKNDMDRTRAIRDIPTGRSTPSSLVNNPPFKAGSLASSPRPSPSPSTSLGRAESLSSRLGTSSGKRVSLNTLPQQALRAPPIPSETAIASSGSSSPKPAPVHRYSSSFANRNRRFTSQGSKTGESNVSSGRASSSSKDRSGQLNEGTPGSSGSAQTDEMDIASFISQVESAKDLPSFHSRPVSRDNTINLAKYSGKISGQAQLDDAMSSSSLLQTSGTPPSRRLSNVPGLSTSSSPSRALAHAPYVRSRLSTHSIAEEVTGASGASGGSDSPQIHEEEEDEEDEEPFIFPQDNI